MRRGWFFPIGLLAGSLALSACYSSNSVDPTVADNGDSITNVSFHPISNTLSPDYSVDILGQDGFTIAQTLPVLQTLLTGPEGAPDDVILESGTNDVFRRTPTWQADLDTEASMVANTQCVIFVNVSSHADYFNIQDGLPPMVPSINAAMAEEVAAHPNFHLLDWDAFIDKPGNYGAYIYHSHYGLGVHPNAAGQQVLANLELQALQQDCP
ncbi:MAG TPA: SGNH/GDSL hydrolase family protein [Acidimicrobiales bacterium]